MFQDFFYHGHTRTITALFGSLFNNIHIVRHDASENILSQEKVPLAYGPRQKFLARNDEQENLKDLKVAIKLPRLSFEMTGMDYDSSRQLNKFCRTRLPATDGDTDHAAQLKSGVPYNLSYELNIISKNQTDALQIIEQILPTFKPSYSVKIKPINSQSSIEQDVIFKLNSVSINDQYESTFEERRVLVYTLSFDAKMIFFGGIENKEVIKIAKTNLYEFGTTDLIKGTTYTVSPSDAEETDSYTIDVTNTYGFDD